MVHQLLLFLYTPESTWRTYGTIVLPGQARSELPVAEQTLEVILVACGTNLSENQPLSFATDTCSMAPPSVCWAARAGADALMRAAGVRAPALPRPLTPRPALAPADAHVRLTPVCFHLHTECSQLTTAQRPLLGVLSSRSGWLCNNHPKLTTLLTQALMMADRRKTCSQNNQALHATYKLLHTAAVAVTTPGAVDGAQLRRGFLARRCRGKVSDHHVVIIVALVILRHWLRDVASCRRLRRLGLDETTPADADPGELRLRLLRSPGGCPSPSSDGGQSN